MHAKSSDPQERLLSKLAALIEQAEKVFFDACKTQTWDFVLSEPLWLSWTLENFGEWFTPVVWTSFMLWINNCSAYLPLLSSLTNAVDSLPPILSAHAAQLAELTALAGILLSPSTPFETSRIALERWRDLGRAGERWNIAHEWEEIVQLELAGPDPVFEEEEIKPKRRGKR